MFGRLFGRLIYGHDQVAREYSRELATVDGPAINFQEKIEKLKAQFSAANMQIVKRMSLHLARNDGDETPSRC